MNKQQAYNHIRRIIKNKKNNLSHLLAIHNIIENFLTNYKCEKLYKSLKVKQKNLTEEFDLIYG